MDSSPRNKKLMVSNADKTKASSLFSIRVNRRLSAASYVLPFFRNLLKRLLLCYGLRACQRFAF